MKVKRIALVSLLTFIATSLPATAGRRFDNMTGSGGAAFLRVECERKDGELKAGINVISNDYNRLINYVRFDLIDNEGRRYVMESIFPISQLNPYFTINVQETRSMGFVNGVAKGIHINEYGIPVIHEFKQLGNEPLIASCN